MGTTCLLIGYVICTIDLCDEQIKIKMALNIYEFKAENVIEKVNHILMMTSNNNK
jgi:hypothetical protein